MPPSPSATRCSKSELCSMYAISVPFVPLKLNVQPQLSPSHPILSPFWSLCPITSVSRFYPSPSFLRISPWDAKQSLLLQGLGHVALQLTYTHPPSFAPATSPKSSFTPTLGSNQLYIKMIPKKSAARIKAASGVHLCVFRPTQHLSTL